MRALAMAWLLVPALANAQHKQPTEAQCRQLVDGMIERMKAAPMPERDRKGADEVIARAEKAVRENRARGASECDSWAAISRIVVGQ